MTSTASWLVARGIEIPLGPFPPGTDLVWLTKGASTPSVSVDMEIIVVKDTAP